MKNRTAGQAVLRAAATSCAKLIASRAASADTVGKYLGTSSAPTSPVAIREAIASKGTRLCSAVGHPPIRFSRISKCGRGARKSTTRRPVRVSNCANTSSIVISTRFPGDRTRSSAGFTLPDQHDRLAVRDQLVLRRVLRQVELTQTVERCPDRLQRLRLPQLHHRPKRHKITEGIQRRTCRDLRNQQTLAATPVTELPDRCPGQNRCQINRERRHETPPFPRLGSARQVLHLATTVARFTTQGKLDRDHGRHLRARHPRMSRGTP